MELVHKKTGCPVMVGEELTDFRGDKAIVSSWEEPRHPGSTGRVYVSTNAVDATPFGYYPSVFDLEWINREDRLNEEADIDEQARINEGLHPDE